MKYFLFAWNANAKFVCVCVCISPINLDNYFWPHDRRHHSSNTITISTTTIIMSIKVGAVGSGLVIGIVGKSMRKNCSNQIKAHKRGGPAYCSIVVVVVALLLLTCKFVGVFIACVTTPDNQISSVVVYVCNYRVVVVVIVKCTTTLITLECEKASLIYYARVIKKYLEKISRYDWPKFVRFSRNISRNEKYIINKRRLNILYFLVCLRFFHHVFCLWRRRCGVVE